MSRRDHLTAAELAYLKDQRLGRLATVNARGEPQVNPVMAFWNGPVACVDVGGKNMDASRKYRNASLSGAWASIVIDDMRNHDPSTIRCVEIRGTVQTIAQPTDSAARTPGPIIRIKPTQVISWGLD